MASICTSNVTSGFIDLATFDEIEKYLYGGPDATAYFVRETRKSTWFTQVPVVLSRASGSPRVARGERHRPLTVGDLRTVGSHGGLRHCGVRPPPRRRNR